jgi:tetratricopeptide (TPR) repeat protein
LGVNALFSNQDNAGAVGYLSQALESGSEDPTTFLYLAEALSRTGRTEEAAKILERGVAAYPYVPPLRAMLAVQYLKMDQDERAREVMNRHLELFPEDSVMRRLRQNVGGQAP